MKRTSIRFPSKKALWSLLIIMAAGSVPGAARAEAYLLCSYELESGTRDFRNPYAIIENESAVDGSWRAQLGEPREREAYLDSASPDLYPGTRLIDTDFCGFPSDGAVAPYGRTIFLSGAKLWRARFYYADLTAADFSGAELNGAVFGSCSGEEFGSSCEGAANVHGARFDGADLRAADLSALRPFETTFTGALFNRLTRLPLEWGYTPEERRRRAVRDFGMIDEDHPGEVVSALQRTPSADANRPICDDDEVAARGQTPPVEASESKSSKKGL